MLEHKKKKIPLFKWKGRDSVGSQQYYSLWRLPSLHWLFSFSSIMSSATRDLTLFSSCFKLKTLWSLLKLSARNKCSAIHQKILIKKIALSYWLPNRMNSNLNSSVSILRTDIHRHTMLRLNFSFFIECQNIIELVFDCLFHEENIKKDNLTMKTLLCLILVNKSSLLQNQRETSARGVPSQPQSRSDRFPLPAWPSPPSILSEPARLMWLTVTAVVAPSNQQGFQIC